MVHTGSGSLGLSANSLRFAVNIHLAASMAAFDELEQARLAAALARANSLAPARPCRARGRPTHFHRLATSQLFTFCSRRPRNTRRSCSPSTVAWGASSRSSNRLEPAPPPPLSVDVPSSTRGRLVPLSALGHLPDRRTSSTGDILMSKMGARDALSMPVCAACFGVDHPLNVSARPAFARGPDERCCVRPRRAERVAAARRDVLPSSPAGRTCMISVQRAARAARVPLCRCVDVEVGSVGA